MSCWAAASTLGVFSSTAKAMRDFCCATAAGFERRRRYRAVPARPDGMNTQRLCRPQEQPADHQTIHPGRRTAARRSSPAYSTIVYQERRSCAARRKVAATRWPAPAFLELGRRNAVLEKEFEGFSDGMQANGFSLRRPSSCGTPSCRFADYAFESKSHAAGYGMVSDGLPQGQHHAEYMAGLLTSVGDGKNKAAVYLADAQARHHRAPARRQRVKRSHPVGRTARTRLGAVRNVSANVVGSLLQSLQRAKLPLFGLPEQDRHLGVQQEGDRIARRNCVVGHARKGLFPELHSDTVDSVGTKKAEHWGSSISSAA